MAVEHKYTVSQVRNSAPLRTTMQNSTAPLLQISELREQFNAFDRDGSGAVSIDEMIIVLRNVGLEVSDDIVHAMIKEFDSNGDGQISFRCGDVGACGWNPSS